MSATDTARVRIGCAGWSLPRALWPRFPAEGTHLARYGACLDAVEINSSFYRPHRPETYRRWAASVSASFRFSVKLPREITHEARLRTVGTTLADFLTQVAGLEEKLGVLLVQLPPSLTFEADVAGDFFAELRHRHAGAVVCEPRHPAWFTPAATTLLAQCDVARVAADPAPVPAARRPGAASSPAYYRLHGSPRMYWSAYDEAALRALAEVLHRQRQAGREVWCIFDNTAAGAAPDNALLLQTLMHSALTGPPQMHTGRAGQEAQRSRSRHRPV